MRNTELPNIAKTIFAVLIAGFGLFAPVVRAQVSGDAVRIGFITDLSGPYAEVDGPAGGEAIKMAIADLGGSVAGKRVEVILADHQNKVDVAVARARELFDVQAIDVLISGVNSDTSLAMAKVAIEKKKPFIVVGAGTTVHTNQQCSPFVIQYAYNTAALAKVAGSGIVKQGGKSWFIVTPDYEFGWQLQNNAAATVKANGGEVLGSIRHPHDDSDFAPLLLQAQSSKAQVLGLASGHTTLINEVKKANELGISKTMKIAGLLVFIDELHQLGLAAAQGMYLADSWFWTRDRETRAWARRFFDKFNRMPSSLHAADYSAALQYLTAVKTIKSDDGEKVLTQMKKMKINDIYAKNGRIRGDGIMVHNLYLLQVKSPDQSTEPWDYYNIVETFKADAAWTAKSESRCASWK